MNKTFLIPTFLVIFTTFQSVAHACDCDDGGGFFTVSPTVDLVVQARVLRHTDLRTHNDGLPAYPTTMELEVVRVFKGRETSQIIRVFGDRGADCLEYVSHFPVGSTWFFALHNAENSRFDGRGAAANSYSISSCGTYAVRESGNNVTGHIHHSSSSQSSIDTVTLPSFITQLAARLSR